MNLRRFMHDGGRRVVVTTPMVSAAGEAPTTCLLLVVRIAYAFLPSFDVERLTQPVVFHALLALGSRSDQ